MITGFPLPRLGSRKLFGGDVVAPGSLPALAATALFGAIVILGIAAGRLDYRAELNDDLLVIAGLWLCGSVCQRLRLDCLAPLAQAVALFLALSIAAAAASAVLATVSAPYADTLLDGWDRLLLPGFDWRVAMAGLDRHAAVMAVLGQAYRSLDWQPFLLILVFCLGERSQQAWRVLGALAVALVVCILVFPFAPAVGGYVHFGIARADVPNVDVGAAWTYPLVLRGLKEGAIHTLGFDALAGIVAMPSFHAAAAIILGWGGWPSRWLRWPFVVLNAVMVVSAVPIGGHYVVDVLAGAAVAVGAIVAMNVRVGRPVAIGARFAQRTPDLA